MNELVIIRNYKDTDKNFIVELLRLNTPEYFSPDEEADLIYYLNYEIEMYFVLLISDQIVACGGINFSKDKSIAILSWDIVHPAYQGMSLGSNLMKFRLHRIKEALDNQKVVVRTTQLSYKFYEKHGFHLIEVIDNYWAKGFHLYRMEKPK